MEIKLNKDYKLTTDSHNYILNKKCIKEQPKHLRSKNYIKREWLPVGYFDDMKNLYDYLVENHIKNIDAKSFENVILAVNELKLSLFKKND